MCVVATTRGTRFTRNTPYLDYRPLAEEEPGYETILGPPECDWIGSDLEQTAQQYAVSHVVPEHLGEVRQARQPLITKTKAAVQDRLTKEITYWDLRAEELKAQEQAGRGNARLNSTQARRRADLLQERRERRLAELGLSCQGRGSRGTPDAAPGGGAVPFRCAHTGPGSVVSPPSARGGHGLDVLHRAAAGQTPVRAGPGSDYPSWRAAERARPRGGHQAVTW